MLKHKEVETEVMKVATDLFGPMGLTLQVNAMAGNMRTPDMEYYGSVASKSYRILIEVKASGKTSDVNRGIQQLKNHKDTYTGSEEIVLLLAVPAMSRDNMDTCVAAGINFISLRDRVYIKVLPYIIIDKVMTGYDDLKVQEYQSDIAKYLPDAVRKLLESPVAEWSVTELAGKMEKNKGFASRIVKQLIDDGFIVKEKPTAEHRRGYLRMIDHEGMRKKYL